MAVHTEVVPYCWTEIDRLAIVTRLPGIYVTPYKIPPEAMRDCGGFGSGSLVHVPLAASVCAATVSRFFRGGYEWVPVPEGIDLAGKTLLDLFSALFAHDPVRFAHLDPVLVTAMVMARVAATPPAPMAPKMPDVPSPMLFRALDLLLSPPVPFNDLAQLHFDYWGNTRLRAKVIGATVHTERFDVGPFKLDFPMVGGGGNPFTSLLSGLVPVALPAEERGVKLERVLARKVEQGAPLRAVPRRTGSGVTTTVNVATSHAPRIELDGWQPQTLLPMRPDEWELGVSRVRFRITVPRPAQQVRVEILNDGQVYYEETHAWGEYVIPGVHVFTWDGRDLQGVWDSVALKKNRLCARLIVVDIEGRVSVTSTDIGTSPGTVRWVDARIDPDRKAVRVSTFARFTRPSEIELGAFDLGLPDLPGGSLASALGQGGSALGGALPGGNLLPMVPGLSSLPEPSRARGPRRVPDAGMPADPSSFAAPPGVPQLGFAGDKVRLKIPMPPFLDLDEQKFIKFKQLILEGIHKHWSRTGIRAVRIGGVAFDLDVHGVERQTDANQTILARPLSKALQSIGIGDGSKIGGDNDFGGRSMNLAFMEGMPIIDIWSDDESNLWRCAVGAHEVGHTVLREYRNLFVSMLHKGTSNIMQQRNMDNAPSLPTNDAFARATSDEADIDLMKYTADGWGGVSQSKVPAEVEKNDLRNQLCSDHVFATEDDARGLITLASVVFG